MIAISCVSKNWVIGDSVTNKIPWSVKEDLTFFKEKTLNQNILVGANTFSELPVLKNRKVWVFTSSDADRAINKNGCEGHYLDSQYILWDKSNLHKEKFNQLKENLILCGGGQLYELFLPICMELFLTELNFEVDVVSPVYFPYDKDYLNQKFGKIEKIQEFGRGVINRYYN